MRRRSKFLLIVVVALLSLLVLAEGLATAVLERRLSTRMTEAVDKPVRVDLHGWPAALRLLVGGLPRADIFDAGGPGATSPVQTLTGTVRDLDVAAASIVDAPRPVRFTGSRLHLDMAFRQETAPLGMSRLEVTLDDLSGRLGRGTAGSEVTASEGRLAVENLSLPASPANLASFQARLSDARVTKPEGPRADLILIESPRARFEALLTEHEVNRAWTYPGQILLLPGVARLTLGPVHVDVDVRVADGRVVLVPLVPPELRWLVGQAPQFSFVPALPSGAELAGVEVKLGDLVLHGSATRVAVPLPASRT